MFSLIYWIAILNPEAERFFVALGIIILVPCHCPRPHHTHDALRWLLPQLLQRGGLAGLDQVRLMPSVCLILKHNTFRYISWFYYGFSALLINQWAGVEGIKCETEKMMTEMMTNMTDTDIVNKTMTGASCITTGDQVLEIRGFDKVCIYIYI